MMKQLLVATLSLLATIAKADALPEPTQNVSTQDVDYGDMYVVQKRDISEKQWQGSLAYLYGFSNPYVGIHGTQLSLSHRVTQFLSLGVSPSFYTSTKKSVADEVSNKLGSQNIQVEAYEPYYAGYGVIELTPLSGMLNWFSARAVDFDFVVSLAGGMSRYRQEPRMIPSFRLAASPQVMINQNLGFSTGVQTTFERFSRSDWQNRFDVLVGVVGRL